MNKNSPLVIIGLGSQATAWAQNFRDSGREVIIALRASSTSFTRVKKLGFKSIHLKSDNLKEYRHFFVLIPDIEHESFINENKEFIDTGAYLYYAHGYSFIAKKLSDQFSNFNHLLLAPKAIASEVRHQYQMDGNIGAAYSIEAIKVNQKEITKEWLLELASDLGITSCFESTFKEETYADLFSEQTLLCSLLPYGALHSFNHLVNKGISPEIAYMECWLEVKLIANAMVKLGPEDFFKLISPNALIGGEKAQKLIFNDDYQLILEKLSDDIWNQSFFTECEKIDSTKLRTDVLKNWSNQKLTQVYNQIGKQLI